MQIPPPQILTIGTVTLGGNAPFVLIAGPCQLESLDHARYLAEGIAKSCQKTGTDFIFKGSYDKANRSSLEAQRGVGLEQGLAILSQIRHEFGCPVLTDVHHPQDCTTVAEAVDVLQIPAFLSRQTDLLLAAGRTGRAINIKKGQFMAPWDIAQAAAKVANTGNRRIMLCERGTSFGYNTLVNDFRAIPIMAQTGYPVVFDASHSTQQPGGKGHSSDGERQFTPTLARAACAVGVSAIFIETHQDPENAPSDGPSMIELDQLPPLIETLARYDRITKNIA